MGHSNIWTLTPRIMALAPGPAVCVATRMLLLGSMDSCVAGSASAAMQRKLASLSTAEWNQLP